MGGVPVIRPFAASHPREMKCGKSMSVPSTVAQLRSGLPLVVLRLLFLMVAIALGVQMVRSNLFESTNQLLPWLAFLAVMVGAGLVLAADVFIRRKKLDVITAVYFGAVIGLFLSYVLQLGLTPLMEGLRSDVADWVNLAIAAITCYTAISVLLQTRDDFRFIIPYVEFAKEMKGLKPLILDTSVVIDGRIADLVETRAVDNPLVMPQFVIAELQGIADSSDKLRRGRGRRGLDILARLQSDPKVEIQIFDRELPEFAGQSVDQKLVLLARHLDGKVVTNDYNLNKVAKLHNVGVVNLNDIANSLKPIFLPGERLQVRLVKPGEETHQGVGYLDDGTMVVIEGGRPHVGEQISAEVTSVLQTSAGRMVFGRFESLVGKGGGEAKGRAESA